MAFFKKPGNDFFSFSPQIHGNSTFKNSFSHESLLIYVDSAVAGFMYENLPFLIKIIQNKSS